MRWVLFALLATGCQKLFSLQHVDKPAADAAVDAPPSDVGIDAPEAHACLLDNFDTGTIDTAKFYVTQPPHGTTSAANGGVLVTWPNAILTADYGGVETNAGYDMRGGEATIDVLSFSGDKAEAQLYVTYDATHSYHISVDLASVSFWLQDGGNDTKLDSMTYSTTPLTLTIAHDLATDMVTYTFLSGNGSAPYSHTIATAFTLQNVTVDFNAGSYGAATNSGSAQFDNFGLSSAFCR